VVSPWFLVDRKGVFWFLTHTGLIRLSDNRLAYFNPGLHILDKICLISEDSKGNTWFSSNLYGITKYDGSFFTHYTKDNGLSDNPITSMMIDQNDNIWIGTRYKGLNKFDGKNFTTYSNEQGLSENKILCTIEDHQENIWTGTSGGGINKLNDNGFSEKFALDKLNNSRVRPIIKDKTGKLWFGTEAGGLYSYDGTALIKHLDRNFYDVKGFRSVLEDKENNLWFGEHDSAGFYKYDFKQFLYYSPILKASSNLSLYEDRTELSGSEHQQKVWPLLMGRRLLIIAKLKDFQVTGFLLPFRIKKIIYGLEQSKVV
jgi:ligand-binding sensor domain-containing protein